MKTAKQCTHIHGSTHARARAHTHTHTHIYIYIYIYIYISMCLYTINTHFLLQFTHDRLFLLKYSKYKFSNHYQSHYLENCSVQKHKEKIIYIYIPNCFFSKEEEKQNMNLKEKNTLNSER